MPKCRDVLEAGIRRAQQICHSETYATKEGQSFIAASTEDDIYRAYGVILAISRYTDKLVLFSKVLLRDKLLYKRAPRQMLWRYAAYL